MAPNARFERESLELLGRCTFCRWIFVRVLAFNFCSTIHSHTSGSPSVTFVTRNFHAHSGWDVMRFVFFFSISNRFSFLFLKLETRKLEISIYLNSQCVDIISCNFIQDIWQSFLFLYFIKEPMKTRRLTGFKVVKQIYYLQKSSLLNLGSI